MNSVRVGEAFCPHRRGAYLLASSIATAHWAVILGLGVVTCADETHHLCAVDAFAIASGDRTFKKGLQDKAFLNIAL